MRDYLGFYRDYLKLCEDYELHLNGDDSGLFIVPGKCPDWAQEQLLEDAQTALQTYDKKYYP